MHPPAFLALIPPTCSRLSTHTPLRSGFLMTSRMLGMFRRAGDAPKYEQLYLLPIVGAAAAFLLTSGGGGGTIPLLYLASALSCIFAIGGLATQETAAKGNMLGVLGVGGGIAATLVGAAAPRPLLLQMLGTMGAGGLTGLAVASKVGVTELPQLVAAFHSLVGVAAVATAFSSLLIEISHEATISVVHQVVSPPVAGPLDTATSAVSRRAPGAPPPFAVPWTRAPRHMQRLSLPARRWAH